MTIDEAVAQVKELTKLESGSVSMDSTVFDWVNLAYREVVKQARPRHLMVPRFSVDIATALTGAALTLPSDFLVEDKVIYTVSGTPSKSWTLAEGHGRVPPAPIWGKPKVYEIVFRADETPGIMVEPYEAMNPSGDTLEVNYFKLPPILTTGQRFVIGVLDEDIIRRAANIGFIYLNKPGQAKEIMAPITPQSKPNEDK